MSTELPKTYDPAAVEPEAYKVWLDENLFAADPKKPGEPYSIVIPPPNVTGALHLGHAINNTLQDILTRKARMEGKNTLWVPGIDHAGIATQAVVEKQLKEKENKTRHEVGREGLVERIWQWKNQYGDRILSQLKRMGASCDWNRTRFTLDEMCARAVRETFFKLFKDGLIYRGKRLVNWDIHLQTSISDDEIYHETVKTFLWHIKYPIVDGEARRHEGTEARSEGGVASASSPSPLAGEGRGEGEARQASSRNSPTDSPGLTPHPNPLPQGEREPESRPMHMTVATTRPETMLGDTAVAVHSEDPRWNWAIGKFVELPLTGRKIPIIADDTLVDPKFGSGVVKVTPAHDPNDYAVWQRHQGKADQIDIINILNSNGTLNENAGAYNGMKRDAARKKVVEDLTAQGLLVKEEPYETQVGHSDRSKTPVEPYLSDQWFVKMAPLAEPALEVVRNGTIKFFPARHAQQYLAWLGEKRDWPISRQLWWGHRIPVWTKHCEANDRDVFHTLDQILPDNLEEILEDRKGTEEDSSLRIVNRDTGEVVWPTAQELNHGLPYPITVLVTFRTDCKHATALERNGFVQDPDVLDTWFSSALWPHSTLGWPEENPWLEKYYPTSVLLTGRDIITLWVARMVMMGMYNMGERARRHEGTKTRSEGGLASASTPSPLAGEGRGEGEARQTSSRNSPTGSPSLTPHPNPLPQGERGPDRAEAKRLGIPFYHVAINPTILDGKGERMSKSKGNGVDPVDIIETHGADALRFTLATMATETQDVRMPVKKLPDGRNTSDKFDLGRNFCNKLWNASRFILTNLEQAQRHEGTEARSEGQDIEASASSPSSLSTSSPTSCLRASVPSCLADRWIISRFNKTVEESNQALAEYRFDIYAKAVYSFFWDDFCDWYIEASKPAMKDPARAGHTADILATILDGTLRLLHPIIPFITETIWWKLNEIRPQRGTPEIPSAISKRLIIAEWPKVGKTDPDAEHVFPRLQDVIKTIRNIRNDYKVDPKKSVTVSIAPPSEDAARVTRENQQLIELLATCTIKTVQMNLTPPPNSARGIVNNCEVYVEGLVDENAEAQRIAKRKEELTKQIAALQGRLSNEGYIAKAPVKLVEETKKQLADAQAELAKLGN